MTQEQWANLVKLLVFIIPPYFIWRILVVFGVPGFRKLMDKLYEDRIAKADGIADRVDSLEDRLGVIELAIQARSAEVAVLKEQTKDIPTMSDTLRRLDRSIESFTHEVTLLREGLAEMKGRWDGRERRGQTNDR